MSSRYTEMKAYLDACCINRFTDDQSQERIRRETAAIEMILKRVRHGSIQWVSSEPLSDEMWTEDWKVPPC